MYGVGGNEWDFGPGPERGRNGPEKRATRDNQSATRQNCWSKMYCFHIVDRPTLHSYQPTRRGKQPPVQSSTASNVARPILSSRSRANDHVTQSQALGRSVGGQLLGRNNRLVTLVRGATPGQGSMIMVKCQDIYITGRNLITAELVGCCVFELAPTPSLPGCREREGAGLRMGWSEGREGQPSSS